MQLVFPQVGESVCVCVCDSEVDVPSVCVCSAPSCVAACIGEENMAVQEQLSPEPHRVCDGAL